MGTASGHLESGNFVGFSCKRHHRSTLVFPRPLCKQGVRGSKPLTSTKFPMKMRFSEVVVARNISSVMPGSCPRPRKSASRGQCYYRVRSAPTRLKNLVGGDSVPEAWILGLNLDSASSIGSPGGGIPAAGCEVAEARQHEADPHHALDSPGRPDRRKGFGTRSRETGCARSHRGRLRSAASIRMVVYCGVPRARRGRCAVAGQGSRVVVTDASVRSRGAGAGIPSHAWIVEGGASSDGGLRI